MGVVVVSWTVQVLLLVCQRKKQYETFEPLLLKLDVMEESLSLVVRERHKQRQEPLQVWQVTPSASTANNRTHQQNMSGINAGI
jgi:hypothetical protein